MAETIGENLDLILPLTKDTKPGFPRFGKREWQDWYKTAQKAAELSKKLPDSKVLVLSAVWSKNPKTGEVQKEAKDFYDALIEHGVDPSRIEYDERGYDTKGQARAVAWRLKAEKNAKLHLVHSALHLRAPHTFKNIPKTSYKTWGRPRLDDIPVEALGLLALTFPNIKIGTYNLGSRVRRLYAKKRLATVEARKQGKFY